MKDILFPKRFSPQLSKIIFFLLVFFLPQQFGPHFWPYFTFVKGIRVDYLSPTLYVSDMLIALLFFTSFLTVFKNKQTLSFFQNKLTYVFFIFLAIPLLYSYSFTALLYGLLKVIEYLYLGLYIAIQIKKSDIPTFIEVFTVGALLQALLAIAQYFNQGSLNGIFYFMGERYYTLSSIGVAAMNTSDGLLVRPYGTFPHPNVLSFYLLTASVFLAYSIITTRAPKLKIAATVCFVIIQTALFLTFSRTILICDIAFLLYLLILLLHKWKTIRKGILSFGIIIIILMGVYLTAFNIRFLNFSGIWNDFLLRQDLSSIGIQSIKEYPLGLGVNNFYYFESTKQLTFSATYLQPIHNIFLLLASTTGIICTLLFAYFLRVTLLSLREGVTRAGEFTFSKAVLFLFLCVIFVGMFDHFFLTIQQGQLLLALILGLSWNKK